MTRPLLLAAVPALVATLAWGAAASLDVAADDLAAGTDATAACDTDGVTTRHEVGDPDFRRVASVHVEGVDAVACAGRAVHVVLSAADGAVLAGPLTDQVPLDGSGDVSIAFDVDVLAEDVAAIDVVLARDEVPASPEHRSLTGTEGGETIFTGRVGEEVFFEEVGTTNPVVGWEVRTPAGDPLFTDTDMRILDPGRHVLPSSGTYTVVVDPTDDPWELGLWLVPEPDVCTGTVDVAYASGTTTGCPGFGSLESPGAEDHLLVDLTAGDEVFVEEVRHGGGTSGVDWRALLPDGTTWFTDDNLELGDPGRMTAPTTGTYRFEVNVDPRDPRRDVTFGLTVHSVPVDDEATLTLGVDASGTVESPGARDVWTFEGSTGQTLTAQEVAADVAVWNLDWRLLAPSGAVVFEDARLGRSPAPGLVTLPEDGTYRVEVGGTDDPGTGDYTVRLDP